MDSANRAEVGMVKHATKRWSIEEKKRIVGETLASGTSVAKVAQKHGVSIRWRRLSSLEGLRRPAPSLSLGQY